MKKITLKTKWNKDKIICAKTPGECWGCRDRFSCEEMEFTYDEYQDLQQTMKNKYGIDDTKCKGR